MEGLLVGGGTALAGVIIMLFMIVRERIKKARERTGMVMDDGSARRPIKSRLIEAGIYSGLAIFIFLAFYIYITPITSYSGKVEKKEYVKRGSGTRGLANYYLWVDGRKRSVERDIYVAVEPGDEIHHHFASQWFHINGQRRMAESGAWNTAFWGGLLFVCWLAFSVGAFCSRGKDSQE